MDLSRSLQLMPWLCFSRTPLTIDELRWAIVVDANCSYDSLEECRSSIDWTDTDNSLENRLNYLSGGLASLVWAELADPEGQTSDNENGNEKNVIDESGADSSATMEDGSVIKAVGKNTRRFAQFIHQSVKDYLISSGLEKMNNYAKRSVIGRGHHSLSRACIKYVSMKEVLAFAHGLEARQKATSKATASGSETKGNEKSQLAKPEPLQSTKGKAIEDKPNIEKDDGISNHS